jgi:two-component system cell cycle response regulator DivK
MVCVDVVMMNAAARREGPEAARRPSLLIVDDVADTRELYALYFKTRGFTVFTAMDGRGGIDVAIEWRPELIVMDLSMPGMDGIAAMQALRRDARVRHTPIIILTGYPLRAVQSGALEAGAAALLTKPCLPEELEQHVRRLLPDDPLEPTR